MAFEAIARLGSAVRAAQELCVTPSAISHRIRQLEEILDIRLFARTSADFPLTPEGRNYLETVRTALESLGRFPVATHRGERRKLRLAVTPTFAREILMPRLHLFGAAYPEVELTLQVSIPLVDVKAEESDLEIRFGTGPYRGLEAVRVLDDAVSPICSPAYLSKHGPFEAPSDLAKATLLRSPLEPWRTWFNAIGLDRPEPRDGAQFHDLGLMFDAAANDQGIALARLKLAKSWLDTGRVVRLSERTVPSPYTHFLCYRKETLERYECASFVEWLQSELTDK